MDMPRLKCVFVAFAICVGSSSARCETPNKAVIAVYPDRSNRRSLAIQDVKPYHFTRPRDDARGIRVVFEATSAPIGPQPKSLTDGYVSAVLSPALRRDWDIVLLSVYEVGAAEGELRRPDPSIIVPSRCNDYCNNETRYFLGDLKADRRYRIEYLLWPRTSTANPAKAITALRSTSEDTLTVKVWYEFALPDEDFVGGISSRDPVGSAVSDRRRSIHN